jgi:hypothetical protein
LDAEAMMGGWIKDIPDFHSSGKGTMKRKELPGGVTKKESHFAQEIHWSFLGTCKSLDRHHISI